MYGAISGVYGDIRVHTLPKVTWSLEYTPVNGQ